MSLNFSQRLFTSLALLLILFICIFLNKFLWICLLLIASIISFFEFNNLLKKIFIKQKNIIYLFNIISLVHLIFFIYIGNYYYGSINLILILAVCIFSDTGGYVVGNLIGGKKLTKISPNKTVSGSIGSLVFSLIPAIFFLNLFNTIDYYFIFLSSLGMSLICQCGDLIISILKRKANVKDTGSILPGHGGLLDRIDGMLFVIPSTYYFHKLYFIS